MALKVSLSVSVPHEMVDQMDRQKREDESRSAYVRRLVRDDADDNDREET
jgi:Arc/MetJ-type ribon-helix-helix transcriptional regulator